MCGRYALALRPAQVRAYLEHANMPIYESPDDPPSDDDEDAQQAYRQQHGPRQSYNFAPGYYGLVYRADTPYWGAGPSRKHQENGEETEGQEPVEDPSESQEVRYKLQSMKWGLIPSWTKRNPDYGSMMKTINCRDDTLSQGKSMWNSMRNKKRCIVVAQGFYEWLKKGKEKVPHFIKRKDGQLMCMAGLWDSVQYEDESEDRIFTYSIITTDSNKQMNFLHDRMPVILNNGSEAIRTWLDPNRYEWSKDLQNLLKPYHGELEIYPVAKEVGKVGNNSPNFIIPVASSENKSNIANFFAKGSAKANSRSKVMSSNTVKEEESVKEEPMKQVSDETRETVDNDGTDDNAPLPVPKGDISKGVKREPDESIAEGPPSKISKPSSSPSKASPTKPSVKARSATTNVKSSPKKPATSREKGAKKITSFFNKE